MNTRYGFSAALMLLFLLLSAGCAGTGGLPSANESITPPSPPVLATSTAPPLASTTIPATSLPTSPPSTALPSLPPLTPAAVTSTPNTGLVALNDLKYRLIAQFGVPFYCDPATYPVASPISDEQIAQYVAALEQTPREYEAILRHLGYGNSLTAQQKRAVFYEYIKLNSITLTPTGQKYEFSLRVGNYGTQGTAISGVIDPGGAITVAKREPSFLSCPVCLAAGTLIDTIQGAVPVQEIRPGMSVWTLDASGAPITAPVVQIIRRPVPTDFQIVHLVLQDGRALFVSPNHPTDDGRRIGELRSGDILDGASVARFELVPYPDGWTYDLLPTGETGTYRANGIWLKSTLWH